MIVVAASLCLACGFLLVGIGWPSRLGLSPELLLRLSLSVGYGIGFFSVLFLLARIFGLANLLLVDLLACGLLFAVYLASRARLRNPVSRVIPRDPAMPRWAHSIVIGVFICSLIAALYAAVMRSLAHPHGDGWDAFAIWNLHARFLYLGGQHWRDGFTSIIPWSHPDYPLLLPASIAHFWTYLGKDDPAVPSLLGLLFTFSTVGVLVSSLNILRGRVTALLGGTALLTTPFFIEVGAWQYADVPLSFFFLSAIALLCCHEQMRGKGVTLDSGWLLALSGVGAGFAAWTKNEGLLFFCAIVLARFVLLFLERRTPQSELARTKFMSFLAGASPVLLLVIYFKRFIAPPGDLFSDSATAVHKLLSPSRYWIVTQWFAKDFLRLGHWLGVPTTLLLVAFYVVLRKGGRPASPSSIRIGWFALLITFAGYFVIYLITPYDIYWHLRFSLDRLFLQLWPSAIFLFFVWMPLNTSQSDTPRMA